MLSLSPGPSPAAPAPRTCFAQPRPGRDPDCPHLCCHSAPAPSARTCAVTLHRSRPDSVPTFAVTQPLPRRPALVLSLSPGPSPAAPSRTHMCCHSAPAPPRLRPPRTRAAAQPWPRLGPLHLCCRSVVQSKKKCAQPHGRCPAPRARAAGPGKGWAPRGPCPCPARMASRVGRPRTPATRGRP